MADESREILCFAMAGPCYRPVVDLRLPDSYGVAYRMVRVCPDGACSGFLGIPALRRDNRYRVRFHILDADCQSGE